jgi:ABC-type iron transport system FetAB permease component
MDKNFLSNDFTDNIDLTKIDKNIKLCKIIIILGSIYSILEIGRWLKLFLANKGFYLQNDKFHYVLQFIFGTIPVVTLIIISWICYLKASRILKISIQENNYILFNKAYGLINTTSTLSVIGNVISLTGIIISIILE